MVRTRLLMAAAVVVVAAGAMAGHAFGTSTVNHLTFSGTVALPGVLLPRGAYVFEVMAPGPAGDVVRVSGRDGRHYYMGFTRRITPPPAARRGPLVTFAEVPEGTPPPIAAWFPIGSSRGHEFIYPR